MRPDPAAFWGIAHHQIVQPRMGNESEMFEQFGRFGKMMIHALHQHRPLGLAEAVQVFRFERRLAQFEFAAPLCHQACLHVFAAGQRDQLLRVDQAVEFRESLADQQGLFLPVIAQEFVDGQPAEQGKFAFHRMDYSRPMPSQDMAQKLL